MHPFVLLQIVASLGAVELLPIIAYAEQDFYAAWLPTQEVAVLALLALHGVFAFLLNMSNLEATKTVTPLVMTIGGNVKSVITVALGIILFDGAATLTFLAGAFITFVGVAMYSYVQHMERSAATKTLPITVVDSPRAQREY